MKKLRLTPLVFPINLLPWTHLRRRHQRFAEIRRSTRTDFCCFRASPTKVTPIIDWLHSTTSAYQRGHFCLLEFVQTMHSVCAECSLMLWWFYINVNVCCRAAAKTRHMSSICFTFGHRAFSFCFTFSMWFSLWLKNCVHETKVAAKTRKLQILQKNEHSFWQLLVQFGYHFDQVLVVFNRLHQNLKVVITFCSFWIISG